MFLKVTVFKRGSGAGPSNSLSSESRMNRYIFSGSAIGLFAGSRSHSRLKTYTCEDPGLAIRAFTFKVFPGSTWNEQLRVTGIFPEDAEATGPELDPADCMGVILAS